MLESRLDEALQRERDARADAAAANRAKAEFLSVMSHELRTPLNAIGGHVQLIELELHGPVTDAQRDALARIARSQQQLLELVNDVLNLARLEAGQVAYDVEELDLASIVCEIAAALEPLFARGGLTHVVVPPFDGAPLTVAADGDKLRQVLINLLTNAIKFTPPGGHVTVLVSPSRSGMAAVTVRDTGLGMAAERLRHVFDPFGQDLDAKARHLDGTGLGLAISRDLARGMGGELSAESAAGQGSAFTLELPCVSAAGTFAAQPAAMS
jgi:signal transduction histidine kinase